MKERLRITDLNWLLIFDSATDKERIKNYLPENIMELDKFTRNESIELLVTITNKNDLEASDRLAKTLKDYPLALIQAATYIKSNPSITIDEYLDLFLTNRERLWNEENNLITQHAAFDNYQFTVFTTLSLIIKEIETQSPESIQLLAFCSFLNNKNIPKPLLIQYLQDIEITDKLEREQIISNLLRYSLVQLHETKTDYSIEHLSKHLTTSLNSTFTIHEITQLAMQDYLSEKQKKTYLQKAISSMVKFLPTKLTTLIPLMENTNFLLPHIKSLNNQAMKLEIYNNDTIMLTIRELEYFLSGKRDFVYSEELITRIEESLLRTHQEDLVLVRFHLMKAVYHAWHNFDYKTGIIETQKALTLLDNLEGSYDEEYLMSYNRLIQFYSFTGDKINALKYAKAGEDLINNSKEFLGNQDVFYHSLAKIHMDDEQFDKAYYYSRKAIENKAKIQSKPLIGDLPLHILACEILIRNNKIDNAYKGIKLPI
jgi:hypothetical protein